MITKKETLADRLRRIEGIRFKEAEEGIRLIKEMRYNSLIRKAIEGEITFVEEFEKAASIRGWKSFVPIYSGQKYENIKELTEVIGEIPTQNNFYNLTVNPVASLAFLVGIVKTLYLMDRELTRRSALIAWMLPLIAVGASGASVGVAFSLKKYSLLEEAADNAQYVDNKVRELYQK